MSSPIFVDQEREGLRRFSRRRADNASSDHAVAVIVEDGGLAGGGGPDRRVKEDEDVSVFLHLKCRSGGFVMIADLGSCPERLAGIHAGDALETDPPAEDSAAVKRFFGSEHDLIFYGIDPADIDRMSEGDSKSFTLTDSIMDDTLVPAKRSPVFVYEKTFLSSRKGRQDFFWIFYRRITRA